MCAESQDRRCIARYVWEQTHGKIVIVRRIGKPYVQPDNDCYPQDLSAIRRSIFTLLEVEPNQDDRISNFVMAVVEALTNAIEHSYEQRAQYGLSLVMNTALYVRVDDHGPGIPEHLLCPAILTGYTSKTQARYKGEKEEDELVPDGGRGFLFMRECTDRTYIATDSSGTQVLLKLDLSH